MDRRRISGYRRMMDNRQLDIASRIRIRMRELRAVCARFARGMRARGKLQIQQYSNSYKYSNSIAVSDSCAHQCQITSLGISWMMVRIRRMNSKQQGNKQSVRYGTDGWYGQTESVGWMGYDS